VLELGSEASNVRFHDLHIIYIYIYIQSYIYVHIYRKACVVLERRGAKEDISG
jgi:hypothetical protein